ncbi:MAG TPA: ATP-binding protein [Terriglobales bacterium]|nr:ATP-binding protein [Terriglobales bacterium]
MSFRLKVLLVVLFSVGLSIVLVAWQISASARNSFDRLDAERTAALVAQFQKEMQRQDTEIEKQLSQIAAAEAVLKVGLENSHGQPDFSPYANTAQELAAAHSLDLLQVISADGTIISSAQWPARFGYKDAAIIGNPLPSAGFLKQEELPEGRALALVRVHPLQVREKPLFLVAGQILDEDFLRALVLPAGTRVWIYRPQGKDSSSGDLIAATALPDPGKISAFAQRMQLAYLGHQSARQFEIVHWTNDPADDETISSVPLTGRNGSLEAILLIGATHRARVEMSRNIRNAAFLIGGIVMLVGLVLAALIARRVTRPVEDLALAADRVASGDWHTAVRVEGTDEIARLAQAFNHMTHELLAQRERLVQTERVAAWRELARRLAHELKNPLFPLQITVENLLRARQHSPQEFEEVFRESTTTLLAEISNLKAIIGRFSDFSKMPTPQLAEVQVNDIVKDVGQLFAAHFTRSEGQPVEARYQLSTDLPVIAADSVLLRRAIENLVLNALDAMPHGGTLTFRSATEGDHILLEITDSGAGLTAEECERLFTPYYTTKQFGTGLGLAIVQSVVSDHNGRIWVTSQKGKGSTFHVELPTHAKAVAASDTMPARTS